jgi:prolyl-tRNA synthetase
MAYTEIKEKGEKKYYYRVKSIRKGKKVDKQRIYLGGNLSKKEIKEKEQQADKKLLNKEQKQEKQPNQQKKENKNPHKTTFQIDKNENFSEWYTDIVQKAELADLRSNVKGFIVFQPWSVLSMEKMYNYMEKTLQKKGHKPYWFPTLIPESNLTKESSHIKGFTPEVFWVTHGGEKKFEEKYALRPTSETLFYQMFAQWIRSYKDLPLKTYQRANVFRYETKATRPFLRSREFHWIEAHCAHETEGDAMKQVHEDMETTQEVLHDIFGLPFIFFERPAWDKFPGAHKTFAADVLNPNGKLVQQPSTHMISQEFSKAFDVKFTDKDEKEKLAWITCYGPAISRIFASIISVHGDNKGLKFPWKIAPIQVIIIPIGEDEKVIKQTKEIEKTLLENNISTEIDNSEKRLGEKFYFWEMKGVPLRVELGKRELEKNEITIYRRDTDEKQTIKIKDLQKHIKKTAPEIDKNLIKQADKLFENNIINAESKKEIEEVIKSGKIARCGFCSVDKEGAECAEIIEKEINGEVRGTKLGEKNTKSSCPVCNKKANHTVYISKAY